MAAKKHVIFLGAGASKESGYPIANELRLLMSSPKHLEKAVTDYERIHNLQGRPVWIQAESCLKKNAKSLNLFRNGGFATLDEFCKLAGGGFQEEINGLRRLARAILGTFNPEEHFEKSEYYALVQALFEDDLVSLRDDIAVLTYNYDPYLEYLLHRALRHRWEVAGQGDGGTKRVNLLNAVTSGFHETNLEWLAEEPSFCVLKLHGSISFANEEPGSFETLFKSIPSNRGQHLFAYEGAKITPPILFPWEIMSSNGLIDRKSFSLPTGVPDLWKHSLPSLFSGIWERARREVQAAEKVSFVGISMHSFMSDGLKYLFKGKEGRTEVVIANLENTLFDYSKRESTHWSRDRQSLASLLRDVIQSVAPNFVIAGKHPGSSQPKEGEITLLKNFSDFIKSEMRPLI